MPLSETAIVGGATGAALMGMRPVAEMQFADFVSCAWDHLVTVAAKQHYRAGTPIPIVLRLPSGGGFSGGPVPLAEPGVELRAHPRASRSSARRRPRTPRACWRRRSRTRTPCSSSSTSTSTGGSRARCRTSATRRRSARRAIHRAGDDVTVITWGAMVYTADEAAAKLAEEGVSVEVLDLRTLIPWDREAVLESVARCSKVLVLHEDTKTGGFGGEIAATIAEEAFEHLDAPVRRLAAPDSARAVRAAAREGVHPAGRRRRGRAPRARRVLIIQGGMTREHRNPDRGRDAPDGRLRLGGHGHALAEAAGRERSRSTSRCSRSRPTRSTPRCRAPARASSPRSASRRARRSRSGPCSPSIAPAGAAVAEPEAPAARRTGGARAGRRSRREPERSARAGRGTGTRRRRARARRRSRESAGNGKHVRLARRRADRRRARRRPERGPGHGPGRPRDEEGHPCVHRVGRGRRAAPLPSPPSRRRRRARRPAAAEAPAAPSRRGSAGRRCTAAPPAPAAAPATAPPRRSGGPSAEPVAAARRPPARSRSR